MRRLTALILAVATLTSCNSWGYSQAPEPGDVPPKAQYQVFTPDEVLWLRAVQITPDTLSGIPFKKAPSCTSCRISFPLDQVDSVKIAHGSTSKTLIAVGVALAGVLFMAAWAAYPGD